MRRRERTRPVPVHPISWPCRELVVPRGGLSETRPRKRHTHPLHANPNSKNASLGHETHIRRSIGKLSWHFCQDAQTVPSIHPIVPPPSGETTLDSILLSFTPPSSPPLRRPMHMQSLSFLSLTYKHWPGGGGFWCGCYTLQLCVCVMQIRDSRETQGIASSSIHAYTMQCGIAFKRNVT